ncbi:MAG: peptidoglycan synthetase [Eudoraea sp.]|nr:peptidoglycan synthetase [Eudoraea sp.]
MRIHFIAIGGSAMHNLALALHDKGYEISGSDDVIFEPSKSRLEQQGLLPEQFGWYPGKLDKNINAVILGMHAKKDNPELLKAQELGLKIYSYPEFLYEQSKNKTRVVIGGSHGKTTITSMILHVLAYHGKAVDFMVGAQLEGFDRMVHLTEENDFIVLEGDEYLSSPIDKRPKFHLYQPNIALLSGIAWDHMNVFPTFENYLQQFQIFVDGIVKGGSITYNQEDKWVAEVIDKTENTIRKFPYSTPDYQIIEGQTYLSTEEGPLPIEVFGKHNLNNLAGAKWICQQMGVDEDDFYQAISTFKGASKRLEKLGESKSSVVFKDFAHSPSKVEATTKASKEQFPEKKLVACLELHTYSSLNEAFLSHYQGTLNVADVSAVFYSPESVAIKKLAPLSAEQIRTAFKNDKLEVFTDPGEFEQFLYQQEIDNSVFLLMSSGNYGGLDLQAFLGHLGIS